MAKGKIAPLGAKSELKPLFNYVFRATVGL